MKTVFYESDMDVQAMINPTDAIKPIPGFPKVCISTFSKKIIDKFATHKNTEILGVLQTANGETPIYKINYEDKEFAFYLSLVGAPAAVSCMEEVIAMGAEKLIFFGSCGVLNEDAVQKRLIVPTAAVRDEGTSYHYMAPSDEIIPDGDMTGVLKKCMEQNGCLYAEGKIWTTDAIYRETRSLIHKRKQMGCIAVDMEYSALLAAAKYRNVSFIQFFYGADSLDQEEWDIRDLMDHGLSNAEVYFMLALKCGVMIA